MSYGVPVLTSNTSSMPEVAGKASIMVIPLDTGAIAKGLMDLLDNNIARKLAEQAHSNAMRFSWEKSAQQLMAFLRKR